MSKELYAQSSLHRMVRYDAKREIFDSLGDISGLRLRGNQVIVAPYVASGVLWNEKLGFPLAERLSVENLVILYNSGKGMRDYRSAEEHIWQGKVCLVVAIGEDVNKASCGVCRGAGRLDEEAECFNCGGDGFLKFEKTVIGSWIFCLQESTRGVGLQGVNFKISNVLKELGSGGHESAFSGYQGGWPCRFVYESDIYGDVDDPDMVV